jgi:hypothetical protein
MTHAGKRDTGMSLTPFMLTAKVICLYDGLFRGIQKCINTDGRRL